MSGARFAYLTAVALMAMGCSKLLGLNDYGDGAGGGASGGAGGGPIMSTSDVVATGVGGSVGGQGGAGGSGPYAEVVKGDGPIGYWRFEEPTNPMLNEGSLGMLADGLYGMTTSHVSGLVLGGGMAIEFQSTASDVARANDDLGYLAFVGKAEFSVELWMRVNSTGTPTTLVSHDPQWFIEMDSVGTQIAARRGTLQPAVLEVTNNIDVHHVVMTFELATLCLYMDMGVNCVGSQGDVPIDISPGVQMGARGTTNPTDVFSGVIDEVAIYDKALSDGEISAHFAAGSLGL